MFLIYTFALFYPFSTLFFFSFVTYFQDVNKTTNPIDHCSHEGCPLEILSEIFQLDSKTLDDVTPDIVSFCSTMYTQLKH